MLGDLIKDGRREFACGVHARKIRGLVNANAVFGCATFVGICHRCLHLILACVSACLTRRTAKGQRVRDADTLGRDVGADAYGFNACFCGFGMGGGIFRVDVSGDVDMGAIGALYQIEQHGAVPCAATSASSFICLAPRAVTLSGNSAKAGVRHRVTDFTST